MFLSSVSESKLQTHILEHTSPLSISVIVILRIMTWKVYCFVCMRCLVKRSFHKRE